MRFYVGIFCAISALFACASQASSDCSWDFLMLSQEWLPNFCSNLTAKHNHVCKIKPIVTTWTIHGLWPNNVSSREPQFCNNSTFDESKIESLIDQLDRFWPNVFGGTPHADLWKHEWAKHGTCAQCLDSLAEEVLYFSKTLTMNDRFNITNALEKADIVPSSNKTYKLEDLVNAVHGVSQTKAAFMCYFHKKQAQYITEVHICLDKTLEPIDCPHHHTPGVNTQTEGAPQNEPCDAKREVTYLPFQY